MGSINKLSILYIILYALSICLINPWGFERGDIWTEPKLFALQTILTCNSWVILCQWPHRNFSVVSSRWKLGVSLWIVFLGIGLISTLKSPFPLRALWGQSTLGDGWIYWVVLAAFVMSNALVLRIKPILLKAQLYGLLIGGIVLTLSIFPQLLDWRIDYTATSGIVSLSDPQMLESTVWQRQMPIGLYSTRGHAAIVLAEIAVLPLLGWGWGWIAPLTAIGMSVLASVGLWFTQVRGGGLAWLGAIAYWFWCRQSETVRRKVRQRYGFILVLSICLFVVATLLSIKNLELFSSGRLHLWQLSLKGITERYLWGWGFNGFGIAFPFIADWAGRHRGYLLEKVALAEVTKLDDFTFDYLGIDGQIHTGILITNKAHNLFLDTTISLGILGMLSYALLWWFFVKCAMKTPLWGLEAIPIAYLIYTLTWYESAQFSHIAWWAISTGLDFPKNLFNSVHSETNLTRNLTYNEEDSPLNDNAKM